MEFNDFPEFPRIPQYFLIQKYLLPVIKYFPYVTLTNEEM